MFSEWEEWNTTTANECLNFTAPIAKTILALKISLSSIAILTNLLVIGFIVYFKKITEDFIYRLVLYLLITDIFQAVAIILISLPVTATDGVGIKYRKPANEWREVCSAAGFVSMVSLWMGNVIIIWIVLYLVWQGWSVYRQVYRQLEREINIQDVGRGRGSDTPTRQCSLGELVGIFFLFFVPLVIASIPFAIKGGMYGISGPWCWIKIQNPYCGDSTSFIVDIVFYYGPLMAIVLLTAIFVCTALICCCRGAVRRHEKVIDLKQRRIKAVTIVLACPILYCAVIILLFVNRIYMIRHPNKNPSVNPMHRLWITHTIADPFRVLIPALAIIINPFVWKDVCYSSSHQPDDENKTKQYKNSQAHRRYGAIPVGNKEYADSLITIVNESTHSAAD